MGFKRNFSSNNISSSRIWPVLIVLFLLRGAAADTLADRALEKFETIANERVAPGSSVSFSVDEVSAWVLEEQQRTASAGIRNLTLSFDQNVVYFDCIVNLVALSASLGSPLDPLSALFVAGDSPLRVGVSVNSSDGFAKLNLVQLNYGGGPAPDMIRQRMVGTFLSAYPKVKLNQRFPLSYNVDRVQLQPDGVEVSVKGSSGLARSANNSVPERPPVEVASPKPLIIRPDKAYPLPTPARISENPEQLLARGKSQFFAGEQVAARESFERAAEMRNPFAMVLLGAMCSQGVGGEKNDSQAVRWFRQAADLGSVRGMYNLGLMYEGNKGLPRTPQNQAEAAHWYSEAVRLGRSTDAAYRLGIMYEEGRGVPRNLNQARQLYRMAATPEALTRLSAIPPY
jgi:hypothetical protein